MKANSVPQEIIDFYSKFRNKKAKIKTTTILSSKFEIDEKYEILDNSKNH